MRSLAQAGHGGICLSFQHPGGGGRKSSVSSLPVWSTQIVPGEPGDIEALGLNNNSNNKQT